MIADRVRLRIAPSPTGYLHVGNVRAALFNWLYARRHGGVFIIRIDDTDQARSDDRYIDDVVEGFRWLDLDWDEGVAVGGPHGTYRQSERFERYREVAEQFLDAGRAYHDFRPAGELDELRARARREKKPPGYYIRRPAGSDPEEGRRRVEAGERGVIRFSTAGHAVEFTDLVRGEIRFEPDAIDDFVILRSDGSPTYHLASTVDDIDYRITHVARGEDLLSSTPKHILMTEALGGERPAYAHLPLLFGPDGRKLSKRHGDTALRAYREGGYLPDAVFNYMSLLGWSLDPDNEIFGREEAIQAFELTDVQKSPAVFNPEKLGWMNGVYMRSMAPEDFSDIAADAVEEDLGRALDGDERGRLAGLAPLIQERAKLTTDIAPAARFLFVDVTYDEKAWRKVMKADAPRALCAARTLLEGIEDWRAEEIEHALRAMLAAESLNPRKGWQPIRVAITGSNISPPLFETLEALPKEVALARITAALERLLGG
ncbi:MAG: glutamate--tRNA ligase [bacterium]|nr:glutamate--tRNA ligase [bacterium]MDE0287166.1 glutamate--tRNA ligase [bacterium]MDE0437509.1 glutamate--tRNA ligase [bacterium]